MRLDKALLDLAAEQQSCIATWQAYDLGASRTEVDRLRRSSLWSPFGKDVLVVAGVPRTDLVEASAVVLAAGHGAFLSHVSGTALWGLPGFRLLPADFSHRSGRAMRRGSLGHAHDLVAVPERWITTFKGIRVARPELLAYQLAARFHPLAAARAFDNFWARGLLTGASAQRCLDDLAQRGRDGTVLYRDIIKARGPGYVPPTTNLESRMNELADQAGIKLRRQVNLGDEQWDGRVDFYEGDVKLVVEVQSERYHSSLCDREADAARRARLEADGFRVLEVWDTDVWSQGAKVIAVLRQAVRAAKSHA